jgi:hypothetical protein
MSAVSKALFSSPLQAGGLALGSRQDALRKGNVIDFSGHLHRRHPSRLALKRKTSGRAWPEVSEVF